MNESRFTGTDRYIATEDLSTAVNAAVTLGRPILIKGEPGTGKTQLAEEIARSLERPLLQWHIKSTTKAQQGLQTVVYKTAAFHDHGKILLRPSHDVDILQRIGVDRYQISIGPGCNAAQFTAPVHDLRVDAGG